MRHASDRLAGDTNGNGRAELHKGSFSIDAKQLREALERLIHSERPRYRRLWAYYRNPMRVCGASAVSPQNAERPYRQAQEWGLPTRITGYRAGSEPFADAAGGTLARKEVVIENDIAWRVDTMVDYLFGKPLVITSAAADPGRREAIGRLLRMVLAHNGGIQFFQQLALIGAVYGFVDVVVKFVECDEAATAPAPCATGSLGETPADGEGGSGAGAAGDSAPAADDGGPSASDDRQGGRTTGAIEATDALLQRVARMIRLEIVEPARALPLLSPDDWRVTQAYAQLFEKDASPDGTRPRSDTWWGRLRSFLGNTINPGHGGEQGHEIEVLTAHGWWRIGAGKLVAQGGNSLGEVPVVHIQNTAAAFVYSGSGDVEPLIPLQDELNTRLSDRAHRISLQSFKMYLGKGVENFNEQPVAPGRMWMTDNEQAEIIEFGGDASCPSEEAHIADVREALDKSSGVTPIAAGAIKNRIGRLTSAAALRVTLLALLSKTDKKRTLYGAGIERICDLALRWLDCAGVFRTSPEERRVELHWPSPLPENDIEKLQEAEVKLKLGVDQRVVLRELGY